VILFLVGVASVVARGVAADQPAISQRPAEVSATLTNSPKLYNGSYKGSLSSRICGETDPMYTGSRTYLFEYPDIDDPRTIKGITDVRFSSSELVGAGRETTRFHVSITVSPSGVGGSPPAYVVNTQQPRGKESGKASLSINGGTATLRISAIDALGQGLEMTIVCKAK
jgi:hypothetical protein